MLTGQDVLHHLLDDRVRACAQGGNRTLADGAAVAPAPEVAVIVVLADFDPARFVRGALEFAFSLPPKAASAWMRAYTRAIFLAGNPANLTGRFTFRRTAASGRMAWIGPADPRRHTGLRRLLRPFNGTTPLDLPTRLDLDVPGGAPTGNASDLYIPTGQTIDRYLVDVHHTVAEATLRGMLRRGDRLRLRHVPSLDPLTSRPEYARVLPAADDPTRLSPLTWLVRGE
jgi:hypothetical protein